MVSRSSDVFVSFSAPANGVFESQVLEYGQFLLALGVDFRYVLFEGMKARWRSGAKLRSRVSDLAGRFGVRIDLHFLPAPLSHAGVKLAGRMVARVAGLNGSRRSLIQARGAAATCAALEAKRLLKTPAVVYDARGDEAAEARLNMAGAGRSTQERWERRARRLEVLTEQATREADHVLA